MVRTKHWTSFNHQKNIKEALEKQKETGVPQEFVTLEIEATDADAMGSEPIFRDGTMVGRATSGCYGHSVGKSLALGYVNAGISDIGTELEIEILGDRLPALIIPESPCYPEN